jgi:hypothetical protein
MADVLDAVVAAHTVACSDLPLVGWDVALTPGAAARDLRAAVLAVAESSINTMGLS